MRKSLALSIALIISSFSFSQQYKVELTEGCVIMKDPISGGIYDIFDWKKSNATLQYDVPNNLIEITEDGKVVTKFYIAEVLKRLTTDNEINYLFNCLQTSSYDNFKSSSKGLLKLNLLQEEKNKRSVLIFEVDATILIYRGRNALSK